MTRPGFALILLLILAMCGGGTVRAADPYQTAARPTGPSQIDALVMGRLQALGITPAQPCSDAAFVRRAYLDVIGTLPTADEARRFLADRRADKRQRLIDDLLNRDEFADYWSLKWADLLRVKAEFPINLWPNAVQAYHRWILVSLRENKPYDQFARELLTASGSNFRAAPVNFYRAVQERTPRALASTVALTFMGMRTEGWTPQRLDGMAGFFSQVGYKPTKEWKEEIVFFDPQKAAEGPPHAVFPDGTPATIAPGQDPRVVFADWLTRPDNPYFAPAIVNRVWCWLMGRGIVQPADDWRPDNPPQNPELVAYLAKQLVASHYDLKSIYRLILNSQAYQLSCVPRDDAAKAADNFAVYPVRRLEAEVLIDAIDQISGTTERYSSPIPEPFTFVPPQQRSILLADGSTTSTFLEMFGRPSRDTGWESERNNQPTAAQRLHLLNSTHIEQKLERSRLLRMVAGPRMTPRAGLDLLYLTVLSRYPTADERAAAEAYLRDGPARGRDAWVDLSWALINSAEFEYRH